MSRSRRRRRHGKCICGRSLVPYDEHTDRRVPAAGCPLLDDAHRHNAMFRRFKAHRAELHSRGADDEPVGSRARRNTW